MVGDSEGRGRGAGRAHQAAGSAPPNGSGVSGAYTCSELNGQEDVSKLQGGSLCSSSSGLGVCFASFAPGELRAPSPEEPAARLGNLRAGGSERVPGSVHTAGSTRPGVHCQLTGTAAWHPRLAHSFPMTLLGAVARGGGKGEAFVR